MKELKYHPIYDEMLICTGLDGIHLFKPALDEATIISEDSDEENEKI